MGFFSKNKEKNKGVQQEQAPDVTKVRVSQGAGTETIEVEYQEGDTVQRILEKANITVPDGKVITSGNQVVTNSAETKAKGGEIIVIAGAVSNG